MLAHDLIALCTAKGVDLSHVGGSASDTKGLARPRKRTRREVELGIDVAPTAKGPGSRIYRRPTWSLAELGQAAKDVPRIPWLAAQYSYAGDMSGYWDLWHALALEAHKIGRNEGWAARVMNTSGYPQYYHGTLAALVLDADLHRAIFAASPLVYSIYLNVTPETWERLLSPRYDALQQRYERWLDIARGIIQRWLSATDEERITS
jgi:hypothetical protein